MVDPTPRAVLPFGTFYGRVDVRRHAPGLEMAVLHADPHRTVERHSHEEAHFVLVLSGLYVSTAVGAPAVASGPILVFNPAGTTHRDTFEARASTVEGRFLTLSVAAPVMEAAVSDHRNHPGGPRTLSDPDALRLAHRLASECASGTNGAALASESLALGLVSAAIPPGESAARVPPRWLARARELLDDQCGQEVRIAELARAAGVHPVHLARVFRRFMGCTPGDYLRRRRLERAGVLLRETTRPLSELALNCGFADQSHFARAFKRHTGVTQGAFRRQARDRG
jgi:AraC family transcriptional regulator